MKHRNSIIVIILLILIGAGGYLLGRRQSNLTEALLFQSEYVSENFYLNTSSEIMILKNIFKAHQTDTSSVPKAVKKLMMTMYDKNIVSYNNRIKQLQLLNNEEIRDFITENPLRECLGVEQDNRFECSLNNLWPED